MTDAVLIETPAVAPAPVVLDSPHSGHQFPPDFETVAAFATALGIIKDEGSVKTLQYNNYRIDWGTMAIGEIAQRAGLDEAYYADVTTMTILGIWTQRWVHVYGKETSTVPLP